MASLEAKKTKLTYEDVVFAGREGVLSLTSSGLTFRAASGSIPPHRTPWAVIQNVNIEANLREVILGIRDEEDEQEEENVIFSLRDGNLISKLRKDIYEYLGRDHDEIEKPLPRDPSGLAGVMAATNQPNTAENGTKSDIQDVSQPSGNFTPTSSTESKSVPQLGKNKARRAQQATGPGVVMVSSQEEDENNHAHKVRGKGLRRSRDEASAPARKGGKDEEEEEEKVEEDAGTNIGVPVGAFSSTSASELQHGSSIPVDSAAEVGRPMLLEDNTRNTADPEIVTGAQEEDRANKPPTNDPSAFLVEATLVSEESNKWPSGGHSNGMEGIAEDEKILVEAHEVHMTDLFKDRRLQLFLATGCLIVVGIIIGLSVALPSRESQEQVVSAQEEAQEWLDGYPNLDGLPQWRQEQLRGLATMSYAVNAPDSWLDYTEDECSWPLPDLSGYPQCTSDGRYQRLSMVRTNTAEVGTIPPQVSLLTALTELNLDTNRLSSVIPSEVGELTSLSFLSATNNRLKGALPSQVGLLLDLEILDLTFNVLDEQVPTELYSVTKLEILSLGANSVPGRLSPDIGKLTSLKELTWTRNSLTGSIPSNIGLLTSLEFLALDSNELTGFIPSELGLLTNLVTLRLNGNAGFYRPLPPEVESLALNLDKESIESLNSLDSELVDEPAAATDDLVVPGVVDTMPSAAPSAAPTSATLISLLDYLGTLPVTKEGAFQDRSSPQYQAAVWLADEDTFLQNEGLTFDDPKMLQRYAVSVFYFATGGNNWKLCGRNSPSCGDTAWLTAEDECDWFSLFCDDGGFISQINFPATGNDLIGEIPAEMSLITALSRFLAPENSLKGDLDVAFQGLTTLQTLSLPDNRLEGNIPTGILLNNPNLGFLDLGRNQLSGPLPTALALATKLSDLQLNGNLLTGTIPAETGRLQLLTNFEVQTNELVGTIPSELFNITKLNTISIRENAGITGVLSPLIGQLTGLWVLQVGFTGLGGPLPEEMFVLTDLSELNMEGAGFSGTIPESIRGLNASLMDLFLNDNGFTGSVPEAFDYLTALETLQIQGNQLTGSISSAVCAERGLRFQQLATLIVDCVVECNCCDNCEE